MDEEKRLKILKEYGETLEKASKMEETRKKLAFPESLLPYPKEEIIEVLIETLKIYEKMREKIRERFKSFPEESQKRLSESSETFFEGKAKNLNEVIKDIKFKLENLKDFIPDKKWESLSDDMNKNIKGWAKRRKINKK